MKRTFLLTIGAAALAFTGFTTDSAVSAHGKHRGRSFEAKLKSYNEVPTLSTKGRGRFQMRISRDGQSIDYKLRYSGLTSPITQSHIHLGQSRTTGGIMVFLCRTIQTADAPPCVDGMEGEVRGTLVPDDVRPIGNQNLAAGDFEALIRAIEAGAAYVNVHTQMFPSGEIRGQIRD